MQPSKRSSGLRRHARLLWYIVPDTYDNPHCYRAWVVDLYDVRDDFTALNGGVSFRSDVMNPSYNCSDMGMKTMLFENIDGVWTHLKTQTANGVQYPSGYCSATLLVNQLQAGHTGAS
ncbi:MAG TPA: hypothetical protein VIV60_26875 [Polyangiaceae bacterium]